MSESWLRELERKAEAALWRVAPVFARQLGISEPPESRWEPPRWFESGERTLDVGDTLELIDPDGDVLSVTAEEVQRTQPAGELGEYDVFVIESWPDHTDVCLLARVDRFVHAAGYTRDRLHPDRRKA